MSKAIGVVEKLRGNERLQVDLAPVRRLGDVGQDTC